jgi:hypothetical protein
MKGKHEERTLRTSAALSTAPLTFASGKQMDESAISDNFFFSSNLATIAGSKFANTALFTCQRTHLR